MRLLVTMIVAALLLGGCSSADSGGPATAGTVIDESTSTSADTASTMPSTATTTGGASITTSEAESSGPVAVPPQLEGRFDVREVSLAGDAWTVAVADTSELRAQGLMNVEDLLDLDGMVFVWEHEVEGTFWMKDTLIPLDIAFFDDAGALLGVLTMQPCTAEPCESYGIGMPFQYALEARAGALADVSGGSRLEFT